MPAQQPSSSPDTIYLQAREATFLKSRDVHSAQLPDADKMKVNAGDTLEATATSLDGNYWVLEGAKLNGTMVPSHVNLALRGHWTKIAAPSREEPKAAGGDQKEEILRMLREGKSVTAVAKALRVGRSKIKSVRDQMGENVTG
ncbi:hypothetical protein [Roseomonas xinghualingensis]|uniref:hypothetical protein n=1 Tax=Roseomonas xinghualingensis TaxID=2986475 RepID=UPI0021F19348|nr:hypothetical protein [Roseomonas sp. SXEYE001]MCV4209537.1 hypothetical protein [Roseomonas sp. SXEYE001]